MILFVFASNIIGLTGIRPAAVGLLFGCQNFEIHTRPIYQISHIGSVDRRNNTFACIALIHSGDL